MHNIVRIGAKPRLCPLQAEKRRAERQGKAMSERTIDAQRASAPVPRWACLLLLAHGG